MFWFVLGILIVLAAIGIPFGSRKVRSVMFPQSGGRGFNPQPVPWWLGTAFSIAVATFIGLVGLVMTVSSTFIYVPSGKGGTVTVLFGTDIPPGRLVATNGEKGTQAYSVPPGWHPGFLPWLYSWETNEDMFIPDDQVGAVTALDGKPLPSGKIYGDEWANYNQMLDGQVFLTASEPNKGTKGPQLTVLPPGQYRYNPKLFKITLYPALSVAVGQVAVIKADAGKEFNSAEIKAKSKINGNIMVPVGYRGIWQQPLTPNKYYLHPTAFQVVKVNTTNRVYNYNDDEWDPSDKNRTEDNSIRLRTKDGFIFPIDIRVSIHVRAEDAPYVVALLADPDSHVKGPDGKTDTPYTVLEHRVILPLIRTIFRNAAENRDALEFITQRSKIEAEATEVFKKELTQYHIEASGVFIADIGLDKTQEGAKLLKTQTDKAVAEQQKQAYDKQKEAELTRATMERERANADQEKPKAESEARVKIAENDASAKLKSAKAQSEAFLIQQKAEADGNLLKLETEAKGKLLNSEAEAKGIQLKATAEANGIKAKVDAMGVENFVTVESLKALTAQWKGTFPEMMIFGGNAGSQEALMLKWVQDAMQRSKAEQPKQEQPPKEQKPEEPKQDNK